MDFIDGEAETTSDILVPSSQPQLVPRSRKRRRLNSNSAPVEEGEYDLPSPGEAEEKENKKSKYEDRIHVPAGSRQPETFVTQLTQQYSSPSRIRGPRWMKPRKTQSPSPPPQHHGSIRLVQPPTTAEHEFQVDVDELELLAAFEDDDDDFEMLAAAEARARPNDSFASVPDTRQQNGMGAPRRSLPTSTSFRQTTLLGVHTTQQDPPRTQRQSQAHNWPLSSRTEEPTHHEIDRDAMATWVYPTNLGRIRDYQYNIVHKGLFTNVLVALPTGLGKTFIAATVMLNWYRWTKSAQIIFVAPTKPLVSQQIDACFKIAGIPRSQTTMLTGQVSPAIRAEEWQEKRVFFMTPQTLTNDLKHGYCDPKRIVLVVVDEAHRATGGYAYVELVNFLRRFNSSFRVLALTATPGKDVEKVQEVIDGLGIARIEIRTEESIDIRDFVFDRNVETQLFDNSEELAMTLELFSATLKPLLNTLHQHGASWGEDPTRITLYGLRKAWEKWLSSEAGRHANQGVKGMLRSISTIMMSLAHNLELLKFHGMAPFYHKMKLFVQEAASSKSKYTKQVMDNASFKKMMNLLALWINNPDFEGHPKLSYLKRVLLNHFMNAGEGNAAQATGASNTRIMVFTHYRDSAEEIVRVLNRHGPMIRAHIFVGQAGKKDGPEGMNQKTQLDVIQKFKAGKYNTLVATSIGEEGLDIGEVDLIVCYDCSKSPVRMLQRMGRTGRKRAGNIVLLMMRGKEEESFRQSEDNYQKMQQKMSDGKEFMFHTDQSSRIVPRDIIPTVDKRVVEIPVENTQPGSVEPTRRKPKNAKKPPKKFHMPDGVETGFAFLGNGKKSNGQATLMDSRRRSGRREDEVAVLPSLTDVQLSEIEEQQLEDSYVRVAGVEDQYIQLVRLDAFPEQQRRLGKASVVKHSKKTKDLVRAYNAMHIPERDWQRPLLLDGEGVDELPLGSEEDRVKSTTKCSTKISRSVANTSRKRTTAPLFVDEDLESDLSAADSHEQVPPRTNLGNSDAGMETSSIGQYDENNSFIDDGDAEDLITSLSRKKSTPKSGEVALEEPFSLSSLRSLVSLATPRNAPVEHPKSKYLALSQDVIDYDAMEDDLPDLEELVSGKKANQSQGRRVTNPTSPSLPRGTREKQNGLANAKGRKRARRVVDDDDDDDE